MSKFECKIEWTRNTPDFTYDTYDRTHQITFQGGISYKASAAPDFKGNAAYINPEEGLLAALSSCHMLTFLAIAARKRLVVEEYIDHPTAELGKNASGKLGVINVVLRPRVKFSGASPTAEELHALHEKSHDNCFIANSVNCNIKIE